MSFTAKDVANLRERTGAGMMDCKNALKETNGDFEKACEYLRQKGLSAAAKKAEKVAVEGIVASRVSADGKSAVLVELNTQTDFVAKNDMFLALSKDILEILSTKKPKSTTELLNLEINGEKVSNKIAHAVAIIGENIQVRRFEIIEVSGEGTVGSYIHPVGNKIGVLTKIEGCSSETAKELARDLSMHIAASQPQPEFLDMSQIPASVIEEEKRIELGKEDLAKKPKEIAEKIVEGRLNKLLAQRCLLKQPFIKDPNKLVEVLVQEKGKELNANLKISAFVRYNVGETVEKSNEEKETANV